MEFYFHGTLIFDDLTSIIPVSEHSDWVGVGIGYDDRCYAEGGHRYCETITATISCNISAGKFSPQQFARQLAFT